MNSDEDFNAFCWDILGKQYLKNINGRLLVGTVLHLDVSRDLYRIVFYMNDLIQDITLHEHLRLKEYRGDNPAVRSSLVRCGKSFDREKMYVTHRLFSFFFTQDSQYLHQTSKEERATEART